jgi:hypothetical protein
MEEVVSAMRRRIVLLVAMAVMAVAMLSATAPAFAQECSGASCEVQPGQTEKARAFHETPPATKPGSIARDAEANEHDSGTRTGRGERIFG